jgi:hypothetical protein
MPKSGPPGNVATGANATFVGHVVPRLRDLRCWGRELLRPA